MDATNLGRSNYFLPRHLSVAKRDVLQDGAAKQEYILQHVTYLTAQPMQVIVLYAHTINQYVALLYVIEPVQDVDGRGFPRSSRPYNGHGFAGQQLEVDVLQHKVVALIGKPYMFELYVPLQPFRHNRSLVLDAVLPIQQLKHAFCSYQPHLQGVELVCQHAYRPEQQVEV